MLVTNSRHVPKVAMSDVPKQSRRNDWRTAERTDCGVSLQFIAGVNEAQRYLINAGVPASVVERVLRSDASCRRTAR